MLKAKYELWKVVYVQFYCHSTTISLVTEMVKSSGGMKIEEINNIYLVKVLKFYHKMEDISNVPPLPPSKILLT